MTEPESSESPKASRWLLLLASVPIKPDYLRVKLRRRVQKIGALALKGAVYLLPNGPDHLEAFRLLSDEVRADGGEALLWSAKLLEGVSDAELRARFDAERLTEYAEFITAADALTERWDRVGESLSLLRAERERSFTRLEEILRRDHFASATRETALQRMDQLASLGAPRRPT